VLLHLEGNVAFQAFPASRWVISSSLKRIWTPVELFSSGLVTHGLPLLLSYRYIFMWLDCSTSAARPAHQCFSSPALSWTTVVLFSWGHGSDDSL